MIFVTLGTQDKSFHRLLEKIEDMITHKIIQDKVIVQAGTTIFTSKYMEIFDFIDMNQFSEYISKCDLLITHGGVGSIIAGLDNKKTIIAVARLEKYGEHENDHQTEIIKKFSDLGHILGCQKVDELDAKYKEIDTFISKGYKGNNELFCRKIVELIDKE